MKDEAKIPKHEKIMLNLSLIILGIFANTTFFSAMVTLLVGMVILGYLRHQRTQVLLTHNQATEKDLQLTLSRGSSKDNY